MAEPQLSVRSARAKTLAHELARKERRSIAQVVEQALEQYARNSQEPPKETAKEFWERVVRENHIEGDADIDLDAIIRENRKSHKPVDL
ncbi:MAG: plasmid stabilization protein [Aestuariivirga sp.]